MWRWWEDDRRLRRFLLGIEVWLIGFRVCSAASIIQHPAETGSDGFEISLSRSHDSDRPVREPSALLVLVANPTLRLSALVAPYAIVFNAPSGFSVLWNSGLGRGRIWPLW